MTLHGISLGRLISSRAWASRLDPWAELSTLFHLGSKPLASFEGVFLFQLPNRQLHLLFNRLRFG